MRYRGPIGKGQRVDLTRVVPDPAVVIAALDAAGLVPDLTDVRVEVCGVFAEPLVSDRLRDVVAAYFVATHAHSLRIVDRCDAASLRGRFTSLTQEK